MDDALVRSLRSAVGEAHVITDPGVAASYETDWTRRWTGRSRAVVLPAGPREVIDVVRACRVHGVPMVPQGGNTGLVGGGVPRGGEVVVGLRRLDDAQVVDEQAGLLVAGAGATLSVVQARAAEAGREFPVDLAARDSATVGGMVATNAGGVQVMRHGPMRSNVAGIEAVLADGRRLARLEELLKDSTGYDSVGLMVGSEGTLAIVTRVLLRLVPRLPHVVTALLGVSAGGDSTGRPEGEATVAALSVLARLQRSVGELRCAELMFSDGMSLVREHAGLRPPFDGEPPAYLLVECAGRRDPTDELARELLSCPQVAATAVAADAPGRARLWQYRDLHTEAVASLGVPHKLDVSLPLRRLPGFVSRVRGVVASFDSSYTCVLWGHLGEGNLHVNVVGPGPEDTTVDEQVFRLVAASGGSISAEHGIGVAKTRWLGLTRSPEEVEVMRSIKRALDPEGLLNPGVMLAER
jgi:FAD/FMN-containing dehydrogenase